MSNKKQSKRENIIALISCGFTDTEIADTLHISAQSGYIRKVRRSLAESVPEESSQDSGKPRHKRGIGGRIGGKQTNLALF